MFGIFNRKLKIDHTQDTLAKACNMGNNTLIDLISRIYGKAQSTLNYLGELKDIKLTEEERLAVSMVMVTGSNPVILTEFLRVFKGKNIVAHSKIVEYLYHNLKDEDLIAIAMETAEYWIKERK